MLLTLLYHQIGNGKYANPIELFEKQFEWLKENAHVVLPQDPLKTFNVCITFDDATIDFYELIFPLLVKYQLKALLAVPIALINKQGYCTQKHIAEMVDSHRVVLASHSWNHISLLNAHVNLEKELYASKNYLEETFGKKIKTFVYPFGQYHRAIHLEVLKYYSHAMRIGNAMNKTWNPLIYRISCDNLSHFLSPFSWYKKIFYMKKFYLNLLRNR